MAELIQIQVPGLVALYNTKDAGVKSKAPVVGYFKDAEGQLVVAVAGDGAKIVPASSVKGYCGLKWLEAEMPPRSAVDSAGGWDGVSSFDRIFGRMWR